MKVINNVLEFFEILIIKIIILTIYKMNYANNLNYKNFVFMLLLLKKIVQHRHGTTNYRLQYFVME